MTKKEQTRNLRDQDETQEPDSGYSKPITRTYIIDLTTVKLRCSGRNICPSTTLKDNDPIDTRPKENTNLRESYELLIVAIDIKIACSK